MTRGLRIEEGSLEDYKQLAEFHYRNPDTRPVLLKIFAMRRPDNEPVGIIMYSWPPLNCSGRKEALGRCLSIKEVNRDLASISRVIVHPKYRSTGLGVRLVKETLPLVGRRYVEVMAVMARYNSFFEKAGMHRVTIRQPARAIREAVEELDALGFKPYLLASEASNLDQLRALNSAHINKVKGILCGAGHYKRLQATHRSYVKTSEFKKWLEKSRLETVAKVMSRLAVLAEPKVYLVWENLCLQSLMISGGLGREEGRIWRNIRPRDDST